MQDTNKFKENLTQAAIVAGSLRRTLHYRGWMWLIDRDPSENAVGDEEHVLMNDECDDDCFLSYFGEKFRLSKNKTKSELIIIAEFFLGLFFSGLFTITQMSHGWRGQLD